MSKVDRVFSYLNSKYCSWWRKRIETPELEALERKQWEAALSPYSMREITSALPLCKRYHDYRPPFPDEFVKLIARQQRRPMEPFQRKRRIDAPVSGPAAERFFSDVKRVFQESGE